MSSTVIVMAAGASPREVAEVAAVITAAGGTASVARGSDRVVLVVAGELDPVSWRRVSTLAAVHAVHQDTTGYPLVSGGPDRSRSPVEVAGVPIGPGTFTTIAGPCAVESADQTHAAAEMALRAGATLLRGGAFKPRSSPYAFQGLGERGLQILADVRERTGLPIVTEVVTAENVELVAGYADMLQVGARNMHNFALLHAVGAAGRPVLLKRGLTATIEEWLLAAEYVAAAGNLAVVLCERGIRSYERSTRNTLDIAAVPVVQQLTHLPVIVDPSHSGGRRDLVLPLTRAAVAVGADGVIVDVHPDPATALCDGPQALVAEDLDELRECADRLARNMDRQPGRHRPLRRAA